MKNLLQAGWLDDLTNWIRQQVERFWEALFEFWLDYALYCAERMLNLAVYIVEQIPVPEWISEYNLGQLFALMPPELLFFADMFNLAECFALIGLGYAFRLIRKALTLGQW